MTPTVDLRHYRDIAVRLLVSTMVVLLTAGNDPALALLFVIVAVAVDLRNPFSLKNFFLVYTFLLFGIGAGVFHLAAVDVMADAVCFAIAFLIGYWLSTVRLGVAGAARGQSAVGPVHRVGRRISTIERAMATLVVLGLLMLALQFSRFGVLGYYQGQQLIDQFLTFGTASASGGLEQIIRFGLRFSSIGLVVLYCQKSFEAMRPVRYRYPVGLLVVVPILFLHRFDAVIGAASVMAIYACERRMDSIRAKSPTTTQAQPSVATDKPSAPPQPRRFRGRIVVVVVIGAFAAAFVIGGLRQGVGGPGGSAPAVSTRGLLIEEFTPVQAYGDIKANPELLGRPWGRTIVLPLLFKVIPRAWLPGKPLNSGGYYMTVLYPETYAAGFALPPTYFGDVLLSFGFVGAMAFSILLGAVTARMDSGYKSLVPARMPVFLVAFANFYGLMRFPISESLAGILLTAAVWKISSRFFILSAAGAPRAAAPKRVSVVSR